MWYKGIPLLNSIILLSSGIFLTIAHHSYISKKKKKFFIFMSITILHAFFFLKIQYLEYSQLNFTISDSVYGSTFYILTGFHGFHVILGTLFLLYHWNTDDYFYPKKKTMELGINEDHFGLEVSIWYWHFVDFVWLILYVSIYWWGY